MAFLRAFALLCFLATAAAPQLSVVAPPSGALPSGPYLTNVTPTSGTVLWITDQATVRYGTDPGRLSSSLPPFRVNQVTLTGLKPATTYYYDIPGAGQGSFTTPPNGHGGFTFVVYGDVRTRHDVHRRVAEKILAARPTFLVNTGDLVADGRVASQWPTFFEISRELLRTTPFFPALGNHDHNAPFWYQFFAKTSGYYSFDWGNAHFAMLNSDVANAAAEEGRAAYWNEQIAWLEKDLENSRSADFRFVVVHHPPYTAMMRRKAGAEKIAARLVPVLRKHRVQAVFSGHDHNYQRHLDAGIQYVVTGGGGAPLYEVDGPIPGISQKVESIENYVFARVEGQRVRFEARALDARVLDRFEVSSGKGY